MGVVYKAEDTASYPPALTNVFGGAELKLSASPFQEEVVGSVRTLLLVLMAAVAFVLLIVCANIATLLSRELPHDNGRSLFALLLGPRGFGW